MRNRWSILAAGVLIQLILGGIYAWSTFGIWLQEAYGLTESRLALIFGLSILIFSLSTIPAGFIIRRYSLKTAAVLSAVLVSSGLLLAAFSSDSFILLLLSFSVLFGSGIGFGYMCPLTAAMAWFPRNKGVVTGVITAGFGLGSVLLALFIQNVRAASWTVGTFLVVYGLFTLVLLLVSAQFMVRPGDNGRHSRLSLVTNSSTHFVRTAQFKALAFGIFAGTFSGLLVIGNLSQIVITSGYSLQEATLAVSLFAIGNATGRISWGYISDRISIRSIPLSLLLALGVNLLLFLPLSSLALLALSLLLGFCFGAHFVVYAAATNTLFSKSAFSTLYPLIFICYGIAGSLAPTAAGLLLERTGNFSLSYLISSSLLLLATLYSAKILSVRALTTSQSRGTTSFSHEQGTIKDGTRSSVNSR